MMHVDTIIMIMLHRYVVIMVHLHTIKLSHKYVMFMHHCMEPSPPPPLTLSTALTTACGFRTRGALLHLTGRI